MVIKNIVGFDFTFEYNGTKITVPSDGKAHEVPDSVDLSSFNNVFEIIIDVPKEKQPKVKRKKKKLHGKKINKKRRKILLKNFARDGSFGKFSWGSGKMEKALEENNFL